MNNNLFKRTEMVIGEEALKKLNNTNILVVGIGGVGGYVVEALVRTGIGKITLIDNDVVSETNINRQIIASTKTLGKLKVDAMEERIKDINPDISVKKFNLFLTEENIKQLDIKKYDYVIDAIDTVSSKLALIEQCKKEKINIISSMGTGNKLDPSKLEITDISKTSVCPLARVIRYELRKRNINYLTVCYSKEEPIKTIMKDEQTKKHIPGSIAFVPSVAGLLIAGKVINDLIK